MQIWNNLNWYNSQLRDGLLTPKAYSEPNQTSRWRFFGEQLTTESRYTSRKSVILYVWLVSEYISELTARNSETGWIALLTTCNLLNSQLTTRELLGLYFINMQLLYNFIQLTLNLGLCRFEPYSWCVRVSRWWGSLTMVLATNKDKRLSPVNHTTKTSHHHQLAGRILESLTYYYIPRRYFDVNLATLNIWSIVISYNWELSDWNVNNYFSRESNWYGIIFLWFL